ncbi:MAG: F0F1 ATP synthase subunit A [Actinomycetota bacterium]
MAAQEGGEQSPFLVLLEHLVPHRYGWSPDIAIGPFDLSISNAVVNIWLAVALVIGLFWAASSKPNIVPRGIQNLIEVAMDWVKDNIVYSVMRPADARIWFPFTATIFFFILFMNSVGLIPVIGFTPTSNIFLTATLAFGVYLLAIAIGMARHGVFHFWKVTLIPEGLPGKNPIVKGLVTGFFLLVESISQLARPFSLAVRLFANMLADHVILLIFVGFIFLAGGAVLVAVLPLAMALEIVFTGFALFVAFIQAVIFSFLSTIYINDALHPGH